MCKEDLIEASLVYHRRRKGKIEVVSKVPMNTIYELGLAYTPGVAEPSREIFRDNELVYEYTAKSNLVAVVSDGSAVLGLGDISAEAAIPVMEGKAILFKKFAMIDAFPLCLKTKDAEKIIECVKLLEPTFGGINLEDIAAPKCFLIEERLKEEMNIPVFHDDQHGTAVIILAALTNALKVVGKKFDEVKVAINGSGSAGIACAKILLEKGVRDIILCDTRGMIYEGRQDGMNFAKEEIARSTNLSKRTGTIKDAMRGADIFIGVSAGNVIKSDMIKGMVNDPIRFAMANPIPEIMPDAAKEGGAKIVGTGRSDFPNQINNVLGFPGIFRGALNVRAREINETMKIGAADALAGIIPGYELSEEYIIPSPFDERVVPAIASAVADAATKSGVARIKGGE